MTRVPATPALARLRARSDAHSTPRVVLHLGTCGRAVAAEDEWDALRATVGPALVEGTCDGACWAAPAATVQRDGHQHRFAILDEGIRVALIRCLAGDCDDEYAGRGEFGILGRLGRQDRTFEDAVRRGAYAAFAHASAAGADRTMDAIRNSTFAARHPVPGAPSADVPLTVVSEDDGPTTFLNRHLLEGDPHRVIEGILVACRATGAARARIALGGQPESARDAFAEALSQAAREGILDGSALGGPATEIEVDATGASTDAGGLTIEAACALTTVFDRPPPPTRLVALSGAVPRPGVYEVPIGGATTWTAILAMAGATPGRVPALRAGGSIVPRDAFEAAVTPAALGRGAVEVLAEDVEA